MTSEEAESIRLDNFLKVAGVVGTGGEAKVLIQSGYVQVNGEVESRRRRKLLVNDVVEVEGETYSVELESPEGEA